MPVKQHLTKQQAEQDRRDRLWIEPEPLRESFTASGRKKAPEPVVAVPRYYGRLVAGAVVGVVTGYIWFLIIRATFLTLFVH